jgi:tetratricopeptide (TPR) repeat protein
MIGDLGACWRIHGYLTEGMGWAQQLLAVGQGASAAAQARAAASTAMLALILGHLAQARQLAEQGWLLAQQVEDRQTRWLAIHAQAMTLLAPNLSSAEYEEITLLINEAASLYTEHEHPRNRARTLNLFGQVKRMQQRYEEAKPYFQASLQQARAADYQSGVVNVLVNLGWTVFHLGDSVNALAHFAESLNLAYELHFPNGIAMSLLGVASALTRLEHPHQAAQLLGAADAIQASIGIVMTQSQEPEYTRTRAELQAHLGGEDFDHCWQAGRTMTMTEATTLANQCNRESAYRRH